MLNFNLRNQKIDLLRGIAILLVLLLHFNLSYHLSDNRFISEFAYNGNYGVTIFFVISGFLITAISIQRNQSLGKIDLRSFYVYRFARIMPCLVLVLFIITLLSYTSLSIFNNHNGVVGPAPDSVSRTLAIFSVLTFWHNILMQKVGYFNYCLNIYWSLSVEEMFYVFFPLICLFFKRLRYIVFLCAVLIVVAPISRVIHSKDEIVALYGYFSCFDAIAIGCCAALFAQYVTSTNQWFITIANYMAIITGITIYCYSNIMSNVVVGISGMALCAAVILIAAVQQNAPQKNYQNFVAKTVCWFGKNSYELYLFHIVVLATMKEIYSPVELRNITKIIWFLVFILVSACVSGVIARFYSQVLNNKLRRIFLMGNSSTRSPDEALAESGN